MMEREGKTQIYNECLKFLKAKIKLDQLGYSGDIFEH